MTPNPNPSPELQRFWLIVHKPGNVPERKGSWPITEQTQVLREFMKARPDSYLHIVTIDPDGAPDVQHGPEALQMADQRSLGIGRKHNARTQEAHAKAACICGSPYYDLGAHVSYCPVAVEQARALPPPTPAETVTVALPGAGEVWSLDLDRRKIYLGNQMLFKVYSCDDFWHVEGVASKDRQWFDEQAKAAVLTLNTVATVAAANDGVAEALPPMPDCDDRQPWGEGNGYGESNAEWCERNVTAVSWLIDNRAAIRLLSQGGGKA